MSTLLHSTALGRLVSGPAIVLALFLAGPAFAHAADTTLEHARLATALRQLDVIERLVVQEVERPQQRHTRYFFDYIRLSADLERIRAGIRDYLTPQRAQPRDPIELLGDYRQPDRPSDEGGTQ